MTKEELIEKELARYIEAVHTAEQQGECEEEAIGAKYIGIWKQLKRCWETMGLYRPYYLDNADYGLILLPPTAYSEQFEDETTIDPLVIIFTKIETPRDKTTAEWSVCAIVSETINGGTHWEYFRKSCGNVAWVRATMPSLRQKIREAVEIHIDEYVDKAVNYIREEMTKLKVKV